MSAEPPDQKPCQNDGNRKSQAHPLEEGDFVTQEPLDGSDPDEVGRGADGRGQAAD